MSSLPALREVTADDADAVLDLVTLCDLAETGEATYTIDEVSADLARTTMRGVVLDDPRGGLIAYAWVSHLPTLKTALGTIHVHPGSDASIAADVLEWLRETAAGFGTGISFHCFTSQANAAMCRLFESQGGTVIRRYYRMGIVVGVDEAAPVLPAGVAISGVDNEGDIRAMYSVVEPAFADHFAHEPKTFEQWREMSAEGMSPDLNLWWLATVDGVPAAGIYGLAAPHCGWIDTLGTLREFRGRGLGAALLRTAFAEFRRRGLPKVGLSVDATNPTGALGLYTSVGMQVEHTDLRYSLP